MVFIKYQYYSLLIYAIVKSRSNSCFTLIYFTLTPDFKYFYYNIRYKTDVFVRIQTYKNLRILQISKLYR